MFPSHDNQIARYTTDKSGKPLINKNNKPYTRVNLKTKEHGDTWISGFENDDNKSWKEGDEVQIIVKQNGEYLNFEMPKKADATNEKLEQILNKMTALTLEVRMMRELLLTPEKVRELEDKERGYHYPTAEEEGIEPEPTF